MVSRIHGCSATGLGRACVVFLRVRCGHRFAFHGGRAAAGDPVSHPIDQAELFHSRGLARGLRGGTVQHLGAEAESRCAAEASDATHATRRNIFVTESDYL